MLVAHIDVDKMAEEFDRREAKILFESGNIDEFGVAERLGYKPLRQDEAIRVMEKEAIEWMNKLKPQQERLFRDLH